MRLYGPRGDRKLDVVAPYLASRRGVRAFAGGRPSGGPGVPVGVPRVSGRRARGAARSSPSPRNSAGSRVSTFTSSTGSWAPAFIKICSYFPYPVKVWINGHEWAKRQADRGGIELRRAGQRFRLPVEDPPGLQADLRPFRAAARAGVLRAVDGQDPAPAHRRRPRRRLLVGAVDAAGGGLPHPGLRPTSTPGALLRGAAVPTTLIWAARRTSRCCSAAVSGAARRPRRHRPVPHHLDRYSTWYHQLVLQALPGEAVPEGRHGAAHRDRHQLTRMTWAAAGCWSNLPELPEKARAINDRLLDLKRPARARYL